MTRPDTTTAQRIALGAAMRDHAALVRVFSVTRDHFTGHHQAIYDAIAALVFHEGKPVTPAAVAAATNIDPQTLTDMANIGTDLIGVDEALAVLVDEQDLDAETAAGASIAAIRRRMTLAETWITADELVALIAGHEHRIEHDERRRQEDRERSARSPWMQLSDTEADGLAKAIYADGTHPVEWAEFLATTRIGLAHAVALARAEDPAAFPGYVVELTPEATGRAIVGALLDAGWNPPTMPQVAQDATTGDPR